jgi:hypothetical protein
MRLVLCAALLALTIVQSGVVGFAQSAKPSHPIASFKRYCQPNDGFCFKYPASWKMLAEIYDGRGVVVAPVQKEEQSLWDEITAAMVAPPTEGDDEGIGLNGVIEQAAAGMRDAGQNFQTLQRQQRTVDAKPAEMLKAQYRDKSTGRDWIEELVFIQGPDNEIYSVALKTSPQNAVRLEPVFTEILRTWMLPEPEPPANLDETSPSQAPPSDKAPAEAPAHHS